MRPFCRAVSGVSVSTLRSATGLTAFTTFIAMRPTADPLGATESRPYITTAPVGSLIDVSPGARSMTRTLPLTPRSGSSASSAASVRYAAVGASVLVSAAATARVAGVVGSVSADAVSPGAVTVPPPLRASTL